MTAARRALEGAAFALLLAVVAYAPIAQGSLTATTRVGLQFGIGALVLIAGGLLLLPARGRATRRGFTVLACLAAAYLGTIVLSAMLSPYPLGSVREGARIATHVAGFFLAARFAATPGRRRILAGTLLVVTAAMGAFGFAQAFGYAPLPTASPVRISSTYFNPIHYSGFLDLVAPFALAVALLGPGVAWRVAGGLVAAVAYANAVLTFSYASWGALALVTLLLLVVYALRPRPSRGRLLVAGVLFMAAIAAGLGAIQLSPRLDGTLAERIGTIARIVNVGEATPASAGPLGSLGARMMVWGPTVRIAAEHPWFGVGPGNFVFEITRFRPETTESAAGGLLHRFVNYAHHDYLQVASETGVLSLLLFAGFWLLVLVLPAPGVPRPFALGVRLGVLALLIHGLMDGNLTVNHSASFLAFVAAGALHGGAAAAVEPDARGDRPSVPDASGEAARPT